MFKQLIHTLKKQPQNDQIITQRRFPRRERDVCICVINNMPYPVENWSLGGVLIHADPRFFQMEDEMSMTLKYRLQRGVLDIDLTAYVVRKSRNKVAFEFAPMNKTVQNRFQAVIKELTQ